MTQTLGDATAKLRFGPFELDVAQARLSCAGAVLTVRPKALGLLEALSGRPGELVTKDELLDAVWGHRHITEGVIKSTIAELRALLGDDPKTPLWIETVPRRGYRFIGKLETARAIPHSDAAGRGGHRADVPIDMTHPGPTAVSTPSASGGGSRARGNAPEALRALVGRDADLDAVERLLGTSPLLTITGPSGVGKTSLALAYAARARSALPDGVWCVELAALPGDSTSADSLIAAFVQTLNLGPAAGSAAGLAQALRAQDLLIVVDNAEHVLEPLAMVLAPLLAQAPGLRIVITSQERLRLAGEQVYQLAPLTLPAARGGVAEDWAPAGSADSGDTERLLACSAVRLFVERVSARQPGYRLTPQEHAPVVGICLALDGLPLALELAAARVQTLGVQAIAAMLAEEDVGSTHTGAQDGAHARLRLLSQGARGVAPRQRTLRDALAWSHALLDAPQRRVFRRVGVFRGGFTLALAQEVVGDDGLDAWAVLEAVQALVEKSLLVAVPSEDPTRSPRFQMLESPRVFALERLAEAGEMTAVRWRHLQAVRTLWRQADDCVHATPLLAWLSTYLPELDNLRSALRWALADDAALARAITAPGLRSIEPEPGAAAEGRQPPEHDAAVAVSPWRPSARDVPPEATAAAAAEASDAALSLVVAAGCIWHRAGLGAEGRQACERVRARAAVTAQLPLRNAWSLTVACLALYANVYSSDEALLQVQAATAGFAVAGDRQRAYYASHLDYQLHARLHKPDGRALALARMAELESPGWSALPTRYLRVARAYEDRLAGRTQAYLDFCREERSLCRRLGAVSEGWVAAQGMMLAEHDAGHVAAALAVGREALDEIGAAGRLGQNGALLALWTTIFVQAAPPQDARTALLQALPVLRGASAPWMLHVALAWLAAAQGRLDDAARLTGWQHAACRPGAAAAPGGTVSAALRSLLALLAERLGAARLAGLQREGETLDDGAAERLALA